MKSKHCKPGTMLPSPSRTYYPTKGSHFVATLLVYSKLRYRLLPEVQEKVPSRWSEMSTCEKATFFRLSLGREDHIWS
jgi:hypothetical protein